MLLLYVRRTIKIDYASHIEHKIYNFHIKIVECFVKRKKSIENRIALVRLCRFEFTNIVVN